MLKHPVCKIITDEVWSKQRKGARSCQTLRRRSAGEMADREFLETVLHWQPTGSPWRDLPTELGYWHAIYIRFRRWEARGVWHRLWKNVRLSPSPERAACASKKNGGD